MNRRIITWTLVFCMVLSLVPLKARAAEAQWRPQTEPTKDDTVAVNSDMGRVYAEASFESATLNDPGDQVYQELEPNDSPDDSNLVYHDYTIVGTISVDDIDCYLFELTDTCEVTVISACTTDGLLYGVYDLEQEAYVLECEYLGYDEEEGLHSDGLNGVLPAGTYCLVFMDYYEDYLEYMFYLEILKSTHTHSYHAVVTEAWCDAEGYTTYTCTCGDSYVDDYVDPLGHDYENYVISYFPNEYKHSLDCGRCGYPIYEDCASQSGEVVVEATCTEDGSTSFTCDVCGTYYRDAVPALGHDYTGATAEYQENTRTHSIACTRCDDVHKESCTFDDGTVIEEATLDEPGVMEYACTVCGGSYQVSYLYRVYGAGRCETAIAVADEMKETLGVEKFDAIILANGDNFADALSGSYLATVKKAPILLYRESGMELNLQYIENNLTEGGTVYILGGTVAVPADVEEALADYEVVRLAGETRFDTNLKILEEVGVGDKEILVCTGYNFADSLSASATGLPILMVNNGTEELTENQIAFLENYEGSTLTIIGGTSAVSSALQWELGQYAEVDRISGETRYETSILVAETYFEAPEYVALAYARNFPDGLCGGPLAYALGAPLILTDDNNASVAADYVSANGITKGLVLGGTTLISDDAARTVFNLSTAPQNLKQ